MAKSDIDPNFSIRLKESIGEKSMRRFSRESGIGYSTLHSYLAGTSQPTLSHLIKLAEATERSIEWLATGKLESNSDSLKSIQNDFDLISIPIFNSNELMYFSSDWLKNKKIDFSISLSILKMPDDSMTPSIKENEFVIIDTNLNESLNDGIYAFKQSNKLYIKRLQNRMNSYALLSDNSLYPVLEPLELNQIELIGKVIGK